MEEDQEQKISKYSSGVNILIRIDGLWKKTHLYAEIGKYSSLNLILDRIWLELARDLKEEEYKVAKKDFDAHDTKLKPLMPFNDEKPSGFKDLTPDQIKQRANIYTILNDKQLFLSRFENKLGKGTTFNEDDDDDFD